MKVLVTGGCGFIGSAVVRRLVGCGHAVVNLDKLTYAADPATVACVLGHPLYRFEHADICDTAAIERIFRDHAPDAVLHLAAETHVDRSIDGPAAFIATNVVGTANLLMAARDYWDTAPAQTRARFRFVHVSTDEVYGDLTPDAPAFSETHAYAPSSPYSASKASADHLARAWRRTYGLPVIVTNCSNNYGPWQFPEKLIPLMVLNALEGARLPIYGAGDQIRDWLYVEDHAEALTTVLTSGVVGQTYNIGGGAERRNIDVVHTVCALLDELSPGQTGAYARQITHVQDRPGHDARYAINAAKIEGELGWRPRETFETGLRKTVQWQLANLDYLKRLRGRYDGGRLGLRAKA